MKEREVASAERHENMKMLADLLEMLREYNRKIADRNRKKEAMEAAEAALASAKPKMSRGALIGRIIIFALIAVIALFALSGSNLFLAIIAVAIVAVFIGLTIKKYRRCISEYEKLLEELREQLANAKAAYQQACTAVQDYFEWKLNPYIQEIVPERFPEVYVMDVHAVEQMLMLLTNLRADTIKEVVNLYEYIQYQNKMNRSLSYVMDKVESIARSSARSAAASERTAAASERTAAASEVAAASSVAMAANQRAQTRAAKDVAAAAAREADAIERIANSN